MENKIQFMELVQLKTLTFQSLTLVHTLNMNMQVHIISVSIVITITYDYKL